jgi:hypothetical protein
MRVIYFLVFSIPFAATATTLTVVPSTMSPAPLGTVVSVEASVDDSATTYAYRFRTRPAGAAEYRTVIDFGPKQSLEWATLQGEGSYEIEVTARNNSTGELTNQTARFEFTPLARETATMTPTANPLVFIYSAPPCAEGGLMRARFAETGSGATQQTPELACDGRSTMNFYLAGMRGAREHRAWHSLSAVDGTSESSHVSFTTGPVTITTPAAVPMSTPVPDYAGILLQGTVRRRPTSTGTWCGTDPRTSR